MVESAPGVTPSVPGGGIAGTGALASCVNSYRISAVMDRLAAHVGPNPLDNPSEFFNLCLSLSRGIDYALANDEVPAKAQDLPILLQQICRQKNDFLLQAAIMVLMISVRNACKSGWFSEIYNTELIALADEIGSHFGSPGAVSNEPSQSLPTISNIMARFYPQMKMGQILASLDVKPGYGAYILDFHISKRSIAPQHEKIRLLVARMDTVEKSSCLITPQKVDFLINGKPVERRTNVFMDPGPQIPTNVTTMLKYGTNLLQAVGQFDGPYIIVLAYMSVKPSVDISVIQDYVQPACAAPESVTDPDIIEGPSRISLNCPISFTRIKTPAKGSSCKHHQCFDFSNFIKINLRRPSWRCAHCHQYVSYLDIRIDQNMAKILKEVDISVTDVIISADGTWKEVVKGNDEVNQAEDKTISSQKEGTHPEGSAGEGPSTLFDLTNDDEMLDAPGAFEIDKKPFELNDGCQSVSSWLTTVAPQSSSIEVSQNIDGHRGNNVVSAAQFMPAGLGGTAHGPMVTSSSSMTTPVLADAVSAMSDREALGNRNLTPVAQNQLSDTANMHIQQFLNSVVNNEYGRVSSIPRHVNRTPVAIQALPVQPNASVSQQRSRMVTNSVIPSSSSLPSQTASALTPSADGTSRVNNNLGRQQQVSRSHATPLRPANPVSSPLPQAPSQSRSHPVVSGQQRVQQMAGQSRSRPVVPGQQPVQQMAGQSRSRPVVPGQQPVQQMVGHAGPGQIPGQRGAAPSILTSFQNPHLQQAFNARIPQFTSQPPNLMPSPSSSQSPRAPMQPVAAQVGVSGKAGPGSTHHKGLHQSAFMGRRHPSPAVPNQVSRPELSSPVSANGMQPSGTPSGNSGDLPSEQNWRPAGRMRGALSGEAYSAALRQFMITPTKPSQASGPASSLTPGSSGRPS